jgi:hypothetical protein
VIVTRVVQYFKRLNFFTNKKKCQSMSHLTCDTDLAYLNFVPGSPLVQESIRSVQIPSVTTRCRFAVRGSRFGEPLSQTISYSGPKRTIRQRVQIDEGPEDEGCSASHCEDPHGVGSLVKCTGVGCGLQVSILV